MTAPTPLAGAGGREGEEVGLAVVAQQASACPVFPTDDQAVGLVHEQAANAGHRHEPSRAEHVDLRTAVSEQPARAKPEERRGDQDGGERGAVGLAQVPAETLVQEPERGPADGPIGDGAGEDERTENADHTARLSGRCGRSRAGQRGSGRGLGVGIVTYRPLIGSRTTRVTARHLFESILSRATLVNEPLRSSATR